MEGKSLEELRRLANANYEESRRFRGLADEASRKATDIVFAGGRSRDQIADFFACCGIADEFVMESYRAFDRRVEDNRGNEILIVTSSKEKYEDRLACGAKGLEVSRRGFTSPLSGRGFLGPPMETYLTRFKISYGIIGGGTVFNVDDRVIEIPIRDNFHFSISGDSTMGIDLFNVRWIKSRGPIKKSLLGLTHLIERNSIEVIDKMTGRGSSGNENGVYFYGEVKKHMGNFNKGKESYQVVRKMAGLK